jgi:CheY-like chemotaxis protein
LAFNSKSVLVGDDDPIVLALTCHILNRQGFCTRPINDREELLRLVREGVFDAMLIDAHIDGAVDAVASSPHAAPRAILTTTTDQTWDFGFATLRKPLEFGLLVETVRGCVTQT